MLSGIGGPESRSMGDLPGVRYEVVAVSVISLEPLVIGKRQKIRK